MDDGIQSRGDQRIASILWRGKHLIVISTIVTVVLAIAITLHSAKVYEATGIIQVNIPNQATSPETTSANQALAQNYATLLVSPGLLNRIRPQVSGGRLSVSALESRLSATAVAQTALVELHATGPSPVAAQTLAKQVAEAFLGELQSEAAAQTTRQENQVQQAITNLSAQIAALQASPGATVPPKSEQISSLQASRQALISQNASLVTNALARGTSATLSAPPVASASPIKPRPLLNVLAGLLIGLVVGVGLAWLREQMRPWLRSSEEAAEIIDAPLLASIPLRTKLRDAEPILLESYEVLRANLFLAMSSHDLRVVTIVGPNPKVGKTSTVDGLARVAARGGRKVLVVDGDMRAATLSGRLGHGAGHHGLDQLLRGETDIDAAVVQIAPGLALLPTKPSGANPPTLLSSPRMRELCAELRERFDVIVIDSPPLAGLADGLILASLSDAVVVVARTGLTKPADLEAVAASMRQSETPIAGLVVFERRAVGEYYYPGTGEPSAARSDPVIQP